MQKICKKGANRLAIACELWYNHKALLRNGKQFGAFQNDKIRLHGPAVKAMRIAAKVGFARASESERRSAEGGPERGIGGYLVGLI